MKINLFVVLFSIIFSVILWISISLSNDFSANLHFPIKFFNIPEGYTTSSPSAETVNIKVRGNGWNIITTLLTAQNDYNVDAGRELQKKRIIELKSFASENTWLTSKLQILEVTPDTISFSFEKISHAKLKIVPNLQMEFKTGYGLASDLIVIPESTVVSGPSQILNEMHEVPTEVLQIKNLSEKTEKAVVLKNISGLNYEIQTATVMLNVQRIVEHNIEDIYVKVIDIPSDRDVVLLPNKITAQLRGGIEVLGKLDKEKISAVVYYRDVVLDTTGSVTPLVKVPSNTILLSAKPERLNYVIKKFKK